MDDLLKEAIADAKAVRETALENAKIALEEAFTPRLQSMLSKKIQSEMEEDEVEEDEFQEDEVEEDEVEEDEVEEDEVAPAQEDEDMPEAMHDEDEDMPEAMHDEDEDKVIEINGVKYSPVVSEEDDMGNDEMPNTEQETGDLDLEAVIKELESEIDEDYDTNEVEDGMDTVKENDTTSGIGAADNKVEDDANDSTETGAQGPEGEGSDSQPGEEDDNLDVVKEEEAEEDIDLEEVLKALSEEDESDVESESIAKLKSELGEHRNVVKYLRSKLNEVNLLNAKLLFTNKLFRSHGLTNEQKMKVVETFDRAANLREVKLVYSTLAESFGSKQTKNQIKESKGSASKVVASTKSKKSEVISEGSELKARFKKLAGIL